MRTKSDMVYLAAIKLVVGIMLVLFVAGLALKIEAKGQENVSKAKADYYHELECRYKEVLKYSLEEKGMYNAGINITSVINPDGSRVYSVAIHHEKFETFDDAMKSSILTSLSSIAFADNETPVNVDFF